ncbi:glycosyltransferase [Prauserella oleivorans]
MTDPVTVIVPAYNESANIESTVRSALASNHDVEVIVVDDGSTDGTADLVESLGLPRVRVIRQPNSGKAAALNTGIATASHELIVMVDGDTVFQPDTVHELVQPFADAGVGAVAANVKIANRDTFLTRLQHIEYVIGFNVDRRVYDLTRSMPTIPGAGGAFRRSVLRKVGGLSTQTLAEDTDLTIAIGRAGWRIVYQDTAVTWTEAPTTVRQLARQRFRWTFGTMQAMWKHRRAILQRGASGRMGRFGLLHVMAFQIVLPLTAPVIDIFLVYGLLFLNPAETLLLWTGMLAIQAVGGFFAFKMDGERTSALWLLPAQQLVYRQLMYLALVQSMTAALSGIPVRWQRMRRTGFFRQRAARPVAMKTDLPTVDAPAATASVSMTPVSPGRASTVTVDNAVDTVDNRRDRPGPARERWLDVLRAVALARVVLYHTTGWGWLSIVFPAMGVMFAAGGSLATKSMTSRPAVDVVGSRIRRLLPPLWVLGIVLVPLMLLHGWSTVQTGDNGQYVLDWAELLYWIFPIFDPPSSDWSLAVDATAVLWYVRAYLWFVLLTPMLVRAFRRRPVVTLLAPLALVALNTLAGSPLAVLGPVGSGVEDFGIYGACWVLGIAHRDGVLKAMSLRLLLALAAGAIGLGGWWAVTHSTGETDLNDIPLAQALICAGVVPLLLRGSPSMAWLDRTPGLGRLVTVVNSRAITLYLWHNVAIALAVPVNEWLGIPYSIGAYFGMSVLLTAVAVLSLGWVEDIAARRPLQFLPGGPKHDEPRRRPDRNLVGAKS